MTYSDFLARQPESIHKKIAAALEGFSASARVSVLTVKAGQNALTEGEPCSGICVLFSGRASTVFHHSGHNTYAFDEFVPITLFGEQEALSAQVRIIADVRAKTNCRFLVLREKDYLRWVQSDIGILQQRVCCVLNLLSKTTAKERNALFLDSKQRLIQFFVTYSESHAKQPNENSVIIYQTRQAIAESTGFSLRTVNRVVKQLALSGLISLHRGKIVITQEQLKHLKSR